MQLYMDKNAENAHINRLKKELDKTNHQIKKALITGKVEDSDDELLGPVPSRAAQSSSVSVSSAMPAATMNVEGLDLDEDEVCPMTTSALRTRARQALANLEAREQEHCHECRHRITCGPGPGDAPTSCPNCGPDGCSPCAKDSGCARGLDAGGAAISGCVNCGGPGGAGF